MSLTMHALRLGAVRGWIEFRNSLRNPQDVGFYLGVGLATVTYLVWNRNETFGDTDLLLPAVLLPSILGALGALVASSGPCTACLSNGRTAPCCGPRRCPGG